MFSTPVLHFTDILCDCGACVYDRLCGFRYCNVPVCLCVSAYQGRMGIGEKNAYALCVLGAVRNGSSSWTALEHDAWYGEEVVEKMGSAG